MHITTSESQRLNILCKNVQDYSILYNNAAHRLICECWHYIRTSGKHLHDSLISLRGEIWAHKTSLT